ncbi:MAG: hypothetical protein KA479_05530 [Saprospiraceae bacterium]|nr:hypothetical protein [Saprospiraceae bacterium]
MKNLLRNLIPLFLLAMPGWTAAQSDDLYYDPSQDAVFTDADFTSYEPAPAPPPSNQEALPAYEGEYDDYSYWDDQGYFYTSRIRRFHQPYQGFNYYDPIYTDVGFYDPWMMPGSSIYISFGGFNDYGNWRRMNRWRMYNDWMVWRGGSPFNSRFYMDPWSYNSWGAMRVYDPWFDPYWGGACFNSGWNRGWGYGNNYFGNNYYTQNNFYNQPGYWYGNSNGTVDTDPTNHYFGPRTADARTGPSRGTVRNPEYVGGGIPRLRDVVGTDQSPSNPTQGSRGQEVGTDPERSNGQVRKPNVSTTNPNPNTTDPAPVRNGVRNEAPVTAPATRDPRTPQTDKPVRDEQPARGTITPAQPERRDPLAERRRWSDMDGDQPQRPVTEERSRDTYRDDYIRQRENDRRPSSPQTNPRDRNNYRELERPAQPERKAPAKEERTRPTPPVRERTAPSRSNNEAPSRSFESPSRSFDSPSRSNSNSGGGVDRSSNKSSGSSSGSSPRSGSGRRGE